MELYLKIIALKELMTSLLYWDFFLSAFIKQHGVYKILKTVLCTLLINRRPS